MVSKSLANDRDRRGAFVLNYLLMPTPSYTVKCVEHTEVAKDVFDISFSRPDSFVFKAGQFFMVDVAAPDNPDDIQPRAYSIASTPSEKNIRVVLKLKAGGRASHWVQNVLKVGDQARIQGPLGVFGLKESERSPLFICTSTGNAPFRSIIKHALETGDKRPIDLLFGVRTEADIFWQQEFEDLAATYKNFRFHIALTHPSSEWQGLKGRVQTVVPELIQNLSDRDIYVCGNPDMTLELKKLCLESWGLEKPNVHVEGFV